MSALRLSDDTGELVVGALSSFLDSKTATLQSRESGGHSWSKTVAIPRSANIVRMSGWEERLLSSVTITLSAYAAVPRGAFSGGARNGAQALYVVV